MTRADEGLTIRPSPTFEALTVLWTVFLCQLIVAGAVNEHDPRGLFGARKAGGRRHPDAGIR